MHFYFSRLATLLATLTCTTVMAADEISGVALGSSLADAKAAIVKANPNFKLSPLLISGGQEAGVTAVTTDRLPRTGLGDPGGPSDEFAALQNDAGKVWYITRVQRLPEGGRIQADALGAALTEKFGKPSGTTPLTSLAYYWHYDRNGKQYVGPASGGPCHTVSGNGMNIPGMTVGAPRSFSPTCGKIIQVGATIPSNGMVPYYTVAIIDAKSMFDELTASDARAKAAQSKKLADEKAKHITPNI
jgi:hypothetical protein